MARPELLEKRPAWGGGKWNATTVLLESLDAAESERWLDALGGVEASLQQRITTAAEGNPLFLSRACRPAPAQTRPADAGAVSSSSSARSRAAAGDARPIRGALAGCARGERAPARADRRRRRRGGARQAAAVAGEDETAARYLRVYCDRLERLHRLNNLSTYAPMLGRSLCALGRHDDAELLARQGPALGHEQDMATQALWRQVQALVHAHRGEQADAEGLAREVVAIIEPTDGLNFQGKADRRDEVAAVLDEALDRYERKCNLGMARQVRERRVELQPAWRRALAAPRPTVATCAKHRSRSMLTA